MDVNYKGTSRWSSDPESYYDFETHLSENFIRYNQKYGMILPWIFMWDKSKGEIFQSVTDLLTDVGL